MENTNKKYAYCTLLSSNEYLKQVLVLNKSLQTVNSKYPLAVMVTLSIYSENLKNLLEKNGMICIPVVDLEYSKIVQKKYDKKTILNTASKMNIFNLKQWDKLVYIDADTFVVNNIDDLFDYRDGSILKAPNGDFLSGLFVICPKNHDEYEFYLAALKECECFDGDLLDKNWFFIKDNEEYHISWDYFKNYNNLADYENVLPKIIHLGSGLKCPWLNLNHDIFKATDDISKIYQKYFKEVNEYEK